MKKISAASTDIRAAKGEAELFFMFLLMVAAWAALVFVWVQDSTRSECVNFGKIKVFGLLYECKAIPEAKK